MATKYGDDYVTAESLTEAVVMAVMCLDELRDGETVERVEFSREGNQGIFPGWFVRFVVQRVYGSARYKIKAADARVFGYMKILDAADAAHKQHPTKDWDRGDFLIDSGRRVQTRLP